MRIRNLLNSIFGKMSWMRQLPLLLILLLTLGIIVAPSFLIPWFVRDITIDNPPIPSAEAKYRVNLERAHNFEELGELDAALAEFQAALESTNDDVKNAAVEGIRRVDGKMNHPFSLWEDLNLIREFSLRARLPIILALLAFLLIQAFNRIRVWTLRPGWLISPFPVFGSVDTNIQGSFLQLLVEH